MPVEMTSSESYRQDLVDSGVVIRTEGLTKVYEMGAEQVHALSGIDVEIHKKANTLPSWDPQAPASPR